MTSREITIQTVQQIFMAACLRRLCIVVAYPSRTGAPVLGTGTAVRHARELFVVTCEHVAKTFFNMHGGELLFRNMPRLPRSTCTLVYSDQDLDLAVLHVRGVARQHLSGIEPLSVSDFGTKRDFQHATARSNWYYVVAGFPGALATFYPGSKIELDPFVFGTTAKRRLGSRLELDYEHGLKDGRQLDPTGMSGALVYEMREPRGVDLWKPGLAVAVEHAWNDVKRILVCSPVHPCIDAILRYSGNVRASRRASRENDGASS